jgi:hypothetical protein
VTTRRRAPRSVRAAAGVLVAFGALFGIGGVVVAVIAVVTTSLPLLGLAAAVLAFAALHFRAAWRLEDGSIVWWLVGLALAAGQGAWAAYDDVRYGRGFDVVDALVFPGAIALALLWPTTVRYVLRGGRPQVSVSPVSSAQ